MMAATAASRGATTSVPAAALNPVMKLLAVFPSMILVLFVRDVPTAAALAALAVAAVIPLSGAPARRVVRNLLLAAVAICWFALLFGLFTASAPADAGGATVLVTAGPLVVTRHMLMVGLATALRMTAVFALAIMGSLGTGMRELASSLITQLRVPYRYAYGVTSSLRFVPLYRQSADQIATAHRVRGVVEKPGPLGWVRRTSRQAVPLLAGGVRHAERLSLAMDSRGFGLHPTRTDRAPAAVRWQDWVFVVAVWGLVAGVVLATWRLGYLELMLSPEGM